MQDKLNPAALTVETAVKVLQVAGAKHVTKATIEADIEHGCPANPDGTLNLVHYAAWLVREMGRGHD